MTMATAPMQPEDGEPDRGGTCRDAALRARARWLEAEVLPHRQWLRGWIARRYPSESDVDDIVQESLEKMLRCPDPAGVRDARVYLSRTAVGLVIDRARRRRIVRIDYHDDLGELGLACAYPLPDRVCAAREEWESVCRAIEALPERTRGVLRMRRIEEVPQRETAQAFGITESAIEKHVRRGIRAVRAELDGAT
jgi:RNA polymerase sigma factor (sigma-70 family)